MSSNKEESEVIKIPIIRYKTNGEIVYKERTGNKVYSAEAKYIGDYDPKTNLVDFFE